MITRKQLIEKYLNFFKEKKHKIIPSAPLIPANDPTVLFTTAGMHPLTPYLLGQKHPLGKRIANVQRCIRTTDIDEVGNTYHHTFFEMLGNWSLGDYWKKEAIEFSFEFLTSKKWLGLDKNKIAVSVFAGDKDAPKDEESAKVWLSLGIPKERIAFLPKEDNWWGPAGTIGPCGPDTEMFYWRDKKLEVPKNFNPKDERWVEIWNDVFMQYNKDKRLILVDGMDCIYDENFKPNQELLKIINSFNSHYMLVVNKFREKGHNLVKNYDITKDTNWEAFSLEEKEIKKTNPEYFRVLLTKFNLVPEEVIYFDHDKNNVETAKKLGILSKHYTDNQSIKKFIKDNLYAFIPLKQKNVDTGMGVERTLAVLNELTDNYDTEIWKPIIDKINKLSSGGSEKLQRVIADHIKASVFIIADGISPSNMGQGYVLRRLIRRAVRYGNFIKLKNFISKVAEPVFDIYEKDYPELKNKKEILKILNEEENKFNKTIEQGEKELTNIIKEIKPSAFGLKGKDKKLEISGKTAFLLYQSYGFPLEFVKETAHRYEISVNETDFNQEFEKHQELSRTASAGTFKSGLADSSEKTIRLHTSTHLLNEALRAVLGPEVKQRGSNITPERLRFDFSFSRKMTEGEIKEVESLVNKKIFESLSIKREEMPLKKAIAMGAEAEFGTKYPEIVSVYFIGGFSKEICTGPHVKNTREIGKFRIIKEESIAAGIRRIKAIVE